MAITPEHLPKSDDEWDIFIKIFIWLVTAFAGIYASVKIIIKFADWLNSIDTMSKTMIALHDQLEAVKLELEALNETNLTEEDLKKSQKQCKIMRELEINLFYQKHFPALESKIDLLLQDRGLIDGNNYQGIRRRKVDLSSRFPVQDEKS